MRETARRSIAVIRTTVLEMLGEPFVFLILLSAAALTVLAPAFHYHQFGEVSRLARDAGCSSFLLGGGLAGVFGAIRSVRREIEGGTCEAALAHAVSPGGFLAAKIFGFCLVVGVFLAVLLSLTVVMVEGMEIGAALAVRTGGLPRPWGVSLAFGVAALILPVILAAALNRFGDRPFTRTAALLTCLVAVAGLCFLLARGRFGLVLRYLPVFALEALPVLLLTAVAGVFAFRCRANVAAAGTGIVAAVLLPALGNYCLGEILAGGGRLAPAHFGLALLAAVPAFGAVIVWGRLVSSSREGCL